MIKFLRECFADFHQAQQDMTNMGIWCIPTMTGIFTYVDEEQYYEYLKNIEEQDENN
jgi:hypothetical protein